MNEGSVWRGAGSGNRDPSHDGDMAFDLGRALAAIGRLTGRELTIFAMLGSGMGNRPIAARLRIGEQTVKDHVTRILHKLELQSRSQVALVSLAARFNLTAADFAAGRGGLAAGAGTGPLVGAGPMADPVGPGSLVGPSGPATLAAAGPATTLTAAADGRPGVPRQRSG